jgi:hypothetical protein
LRFISFIFNAHFSQHAKIEGETPRQLCKNRCQVERFSLVGLFVPSAFDAVAKGAVQRYQNLIIALAIGTK